MDPTITAAWISGGVGAVGVIGTAVTAWIGSRSTRKATEQAIAAGADNTRATLAAAREDRLWEKRAASYEATLAGLLHRRNQQFNGLTEDGDGELRIVSDDDSPEWVERRSRLYAYASDVVLAASDAAEDAHRQARHRQLEMELLRRRSAGFPHDPAPMGRVGREFGSALDAAGAADDALIKVIRDELSSKPEAALQPLGALPAVRRKFWHRHRG